MALSTRKIDFMLVTSGVAENIPIREEKTSGLFVKT
jgi:hypothetical protein